MSGFNTCTYSVAGATLYMVVRSGVLAWNVGGAAYEAEGTTRATYTLVGTNYVGLEYKFVEPGAVAGTGYNFTVYLQGGGSPGTNDLGAFKEQNQGAVTVTGTVRATDSNGNPFGYFTPALAVTGTVSSNSAPTDQQFATSGNDFAANAIVAVRWLVGAANAGYETQGTVSLPLDVPTVTLDAALPNAIAIDDPYVLTPAAMFAALPSGTLPGVNVLAWAGSNVLGMPNSGTVSTGAFGVTLAAGQAVLLTPGTGAGMVSLTNGVMAALVSGTVRVGVLPSPAPTGYGGSGSNVNVLQWGGTGVGGMPNSGTVQTGAMTAGVIVAATYGAGGSNANVTQFGGSNVTFDANNLPNVNAKDYGGSVVTQVALASQTFTDMTAGNGTARAFTVPALANAPSGGGGGDTNGAALILMTTGSGTSRSFTSVALENTPVGGGGTGDTMVNQNTGGADNLKLEILGVGVDGAVVQAYLKSDYDAGNVTTTYLKGETLTGAVSGVSGRWPNPLMLNSGNTYTIYFAKLGSVAPVTKEITI